MFFSALFPKHSGTYYHGLYKQLVFLRFIEMTVRSEIGVFYLMYAKLQRLLKDETQISWRFACFSCFSAFSLASGLSDFALQLSFFAKKWQQHLINYALIFEASRLYKMCHKKSTVCSVNSVFRVLFAVDLPVCETSYNLLH